MESFPDLSTLVSRFRHLGATRVFYKLLSENDNSKQQIYLGSSFGVLTYFPYGPVRPEAGAKDPTFKAPLEFFWVGPTTSERAPNAQLILYSGYPEVRLSGFLRGCRTGPNEHLRPIPKEHRRGVDGRVLFFGITTSNQTLAYLAPTGSALAAEAILASHSETGLFQELAIAGPTAGDSKSLLLARLREIQQLGAVPSMRLNNAGERIPYKARNGGGYTLEALLGIKPNGDASPDYLGWEVKAFGGSYLTLITPEPDGGYYGSEGVGAFVRRYGRHVAEKDQMYFTGRHYYDRPDTTTSMTLGLIGFDAAKGVITDAGGRIVLTDRNGSEAATWSYSQLLTHWNRKHASAAYVPYTSQRSSEPTYRYQNPVLLGERTDFAKYLSAIAKGFVAFDPGSKVDGLTTARPKVKARSQFRIPRERLPVLYESFEELDLTQGT
ncbi:MvaI/BcnI family restriction endonuclease [Frateuria hangzhouensis]|uniref:MvaI/BcnI family restriction endonuclease n=1 Tax=Frateuria hangzhouensis TaxID=2995589 RepID=UPI002260BF6A|nr:MvaI/BcnI family restriction endonuclease [Frateuria sp. STR12]MCX7513445.1 MvaI/BcnI family restriction endonuclease [Frateuria sp. STR12]